MKYEVIHLPKETYKDTIVPIDYTTNEYYDISMEQNSEGYVVTLARKVLVSPIHHQQAEYDYPDKLYQNHWEEAYAWGIVEKENLIAAIETAPEKWSNRLRITELWVHPDYQRQGIGQELLQVAIEQARHERRRALILETQSCNVNAIDFYVHEGFTLVGMDTCSYSNHDLEKKEVRLELGILFHRNKLRLEDVIIRQEEPEDWHDVERMTQLAFWNKHHLGCDEHLLVQKLRSDSHYLPRISRIAVWNGEVIGAILYTIAYVVDEGKQHEIITFGPLCVDPKWQGCGVGELLFNETSKLAAESGYKAIVIFGEPDYYPRLGFKTCDHFGITTHDGKNFDAFMAYELVEGGLETIKGRFGYADIFDNLPKEDVDALNKEFPTLVKRQFPFQWE